MTLPPIYVINLDRSANRWALARRDLGAVTEMLVRVPGVDGQEEPFEDVKEFHDTMRAAVLADRLKPKDQWVHGHFVSEGCATDRTFEIHQSAWRGKYGCYLSHIRAVEMALDDGHERFIIAEDDAVPRLDIIQAAAVPTGDAIHVWGGALVMADLNADSVRYWRGLPWKEAPWERIPPTSAGIRRVFTMLAYEMSRAAGERYLEILRERVMVSDCAWWHAMLEIPTYRLRPTGFGHRWSTEPFSTIGRNAPRIPAERWVETGTRPEDLALVSPEHEDPKIWKGLY